MAISSLSAGISGLKASQTTLNVIGDNLANLNTPGFKGSRVTFADALSQTISSAQAPSSGLGGRNAVQLGTGTKVASVNADFTQGSITPTGRPFDLAIQGEGFFTLTDGSQEFFSRVGSFSLDKNNDLVDSNTGLKVRDTNSQPININVNKVKKGEQTRNLDVVGNLDSTFKSGAKNQVVTSDSAFQTGGAAATAATTLNALDNNTTDYVAGDTIVVVGNESDGNNVSATFTYGSGSGQDGTTLGDLLTFISKNYGTATATLDGSGNMLLTSDAPGKSELSLSLADGTSNTGATTYSSYSITTEGSGDVYVTSVPVFDTQGASHTVVLTYEKTGSNTWDVTPTMKAEDGAVNDAITAINFNADGSFGSVTGSSNFTITYPDSSTQTVELKFGVSNTFNGITQFGSNSSAVATKNDGFPPGNFSSTTVNADGKIISLFTNGKTEESSRIQIATFSNASGLTKGGNNMFSQSVASGDPVLGGALSGRAGSIVNSALEGSNVDIADEFTNLIIAQRAFQANARTITTTDEVMQELVSIVR